VVLPHRDASPLPLLDDVGIGCPDQAAKPAEQLSPPVAELLDPRVDQLGGRAHARASSLPSGSRWRSASTRAKPLFAPSSTPYCIVVSRSSAVAKLIVWVSFVRSPRSSNSSVCRWFWNVCTSRSGASTSRNSPSTTP